MFSRFNWLIHGFKGLINKVDVSHFRLSLHLVVAFLILSLIL